MDLPPEIWQEQSSKIFEDNPDGLLPERKSLQRRHGRDIVEYQKTAISRYSKIWDQYKADFDEVRIRLACDIRDEVDLKYRPRITELEQELDRRRLTAATSSSQILTSLPLTQAKHEALLVTSPVGRTDAHKSIGPDGNVSEDDAGMEMLTHPVSLAGIQEQPRHLPFRRPTGLTRVSVHDVRAAFPDTVYNRMREFCMVVCLELPPDPPIDQDFYEYDAAKQKVVDEFKGHLARYEHEWPADWFLRLCLRARRVSALREGRKSSVSASSNTQPHDMQEVHGVDFINTFASAGPGSQSTISHPASTSQSAHGAEPIPLPLTRPSNLNKVLASDVRASLTEGLYTRMTNECKRECCRLPYKPYFGQDKITMQKVRDQIVDKFKESLVEYENYWPVDWMLKRHFKNRKPTLGTTTSRPLDATMGI